MRIWDRTEGRSKDVYHTKRMQRVFDVAYTPTSTFVMTASDDGNIRCVRLPHSSPKTLDILILFSNQTLEIQGFRTTRCR